MEENVEEIFAEPEDEVLHNKIEEIGLLEQLSIFCQFCFHLIGSYGWYIVVVTIITYYFWQKYRSTLEQYVGLVLPRNANTSVNRHTDPEMIMSRQEGMENARRKMQEKLNVLSNQDREKQKEKEERKRKEKIEEWEKFQSGGTFASRNRLGAGTDECTNPSKPSGSSKKKDSKSLKGDYNPLTGSGYGTTFRPNRRGGGGGSGGGGG